MHSAQSSRGFTLIELMITVAVVALLLALAMPSFDDYRRSQAMASRISALHQDLVFARSEAVKLGGDVFVSAKSNDFAKGWIVYENRNASTTYQAAQDRLLREQGEITPGYSMRSANGAGAARELFGFDRRGALTEGGGINLAACAKGWTAAKDRLYARNVRILPSGRAEAGKGKGPGAGITCTGT
jgi:type IV fimbrial biogenesis protein FimT